MLFHAKFGDCKIDVLPFPINDWLAVKVAAPVPPLEIDIAPVVTLEAFKPAQEPTKLVADNVLVVLIHAKFADFKMDVVPLPINIWFAVKIAAPVPPFEIDNVPDDTFKFVS